MPHTWGPSALAPPRPGLTMYGLRVLLVDDHPVNRKVVTLLLQSMDVELCEAANGEEALEQLASQPFDVVLLDMLMPVMDGRETIQRIRGSGEAWASIPVVAISAGALGDDEALYLQLGMSGYLAKPLTAAALAAELSRLGRFTPGGSGGHPARPAPLATPREGR